MSNSSSTRRDFIKRTALTGAIVGFPAIVPASVLGKDGHTPPSEKAAIGLIACGSRARYAGVYKRYDKSHVVAVSDPIDWRRQFFKEKVVGDCSDYVDFREMLARDDLDAVHIATGDHWHLPAAILAAEAGKDMYIEKPLGLCIDHDLKARKIVDKHKRVVQYGAQQRSMAQVRMGIELVLNGHIGQVKETYTWAPHGESGGKPTPVLTVPDGIDYDLWLGPAPQAPFCDDRLNYKKNDWGTARKGIYHIHDYAIGFIAGWGAHPMDMLQWWADNAGLAEIPIKYQGTGKLPNEGLFNTLTNWDVQAEYTNGITLRFMDDQTANRIKPHPAVAGGHGTLFVGSEGWVRVWRGGWATSSEQLRRKAKDPGAKRLKVSRDQITNFVDCVLSREEPVDHLHSAVRSDVATHLSEIAVRTGKTIEWDSVHERIKDSNVRSYMSRSIRAPWKV